MKENLDVKGAITDLETIYISGGYMSICNERRQNYVIISSIAICSIVFKEFSKKIRSKLYGEFLNASNSVTGKFSRGYRILSTVIVRLC